MSRALEEGVVTKKGFEQLVACMAERRERYPRPSDPASVFAAKRGRILGKVMPISLVPLGTSNAMLLLGTQSVTSAKCFFPLPQYLIWAGATSLSLATAGVSSRYVLQLILGDRFVSRGEAKVLAVVEYLSLFLSVLQVVILLTGTLVILPHLSAVQMADEDKPKYCERGLVIFSTVFLSTCWFFVIIGIACVLYVKCSSQNESVRPRTLVNSDINQSTPTVPLET